MKDNILIAQFMGATIKTSQQMAAGVAGIDRNSTEVWADFGNCYFYERQLHYHDSWDRLMEVIAKIEDVKVEGIEDTSIGSKEVDWTFVVELCYNQCLIHRYCAPQYYGEETDFLKLYDCRNNFKNKIAIGYKAVSKFINWYNKQKS